MTYTPILIALEKKQLEREVSRKDKALAGAAALLTLSKKSPRVSNDNAYAESIFKTMKYRVDEKSLSMHTRNRFEYSRAFTFNTHEKLM